MILLVPPPDVAPTRLESEDHGERRLSGIDRGPTGRDHGTSWSGSSLIGLAGGL